MRHEYKKITFYCMFNQNISLIQINTLVKYYTYRFWLKFIILNIFFILNKNNFNSKFQYLDRVESN